MRALLLSAYDAQSHRAWRNNLKLMFPAIAWKELTLPARHFPWRVRGNSLSWAFNHRDTLTDNYDFLLSTSMTDLSALRGFVPELCAIPNIVYCHENQFAYPENPFPGARVTNPVEPQILSLYTALCADRLVFNSTYNRDSFRAGAQALLKKLPDHVPNGLLQCVDNALIIPVPLCEEVFSTPPKQKSPDPSILEIVWNHRWEYDKGPDLLLAIVQQMLQRNMRFRLHLLGQRFRSSPAAFGELQEILKRYYEVQSIKPGIDAYLESTSDYYQCLASADVALSTADHDFQGLSVLEAGALGCTPLAPNRLVYPEYLSSQHRYESGSDTASEASAAVDKLEQWAHTKKAGGQLAQVDLQQFRPSQLYDAYAALFQSVLKRT